MYKYKNLLVANKLLHYRTLFLTSVTKNNPYYGKTHTELTQEEQDDRDSYFKHRYNTCTGCCSIIYHSEWINYSSTIWPSEFKYVTFENLLKLDLYNRYQCKPYYEDYIFRIDDFSNTVNIQGNYDITPIYNGLEYRSDDLTINDLPVHYIRGYLNNKTNGKKHVLHLQFAFNIKKYIDMFNYVLACYYRRLKYILFCYLPLELIKEILLLTSLV